MIGELGVVAADMRQVRCDRAVLLDLHRPHCIGIDVVPFDDRSPIPVAGQAAHGKDVIVDGAAIGRQQADRHHRIADDVERGVEGFAFRIARLVLVGARLENGFKVDRHRLIAGGNDVLLMHVG